MRILLNNDDMQFSGDTLNDLLVEKGLIRNAGIAIAVNETVISRNEWNSFNLKEDDSVLIITPAQGG